MFAQTSGVPSRKCGAPACLEAAGADVTDVVKWTIFYADGADVQEGIAAWGVLARQSPPPAIPMIKVTDVGPPGAVIEIDAVAAVQVQAAAGHR